MNNFKTTRKYKCPLAICGMLSIFLVIGVEFLCNLQVISFDFSAHHKKAAIQHQSHDHNQGGHHGDHDKAVTNETEHNHHHNTADDEEEGCCDDLTARFFASLISEDGNTPVIEPLHPYIFFGIVLFKNYLPLSPVNHAKEWDGYHLPHGPPGSGRLIILLIHSLLI